ncbi:hypothetical protein CLOM_g13313 [Closterium sp. NIES-68]|nr:hypothetical protein CLOM_g13313 [Closterium sp. NIES-68]GJP71403.1 hypothetical protein CLOP_g2237 [Closterium sp. NIES-67]
MSGKPSSSAFDKVRGGKLVFKGVGDVSKLIKKKKHKKHKRTTDAENDPTGGGEGGNPEGREGGVTAGEAPGADGGPKAGDDEYDTGIGFAPDGRKKTPKYEEMFPFETVRYAYTKPEKMKMKTREDALDERAKKKADKYCK